MSGQLAPEQDTKSPATYHGIQFAKCLQCGYCSADPTTLEFWNDLGLICPECNVLDGRTLWVLTGGRASVTAYSDEHGLLWQKDLLD